MLSRSKKKKKHSKKSEESEDSKEEEADFSNSDTELVWVEKKRKLVVVFYV